MPFSKKDIKMLNINDNNEATVENEGTPTPFFKRPAVRAALSWIKVLALAAITALLVNTFVFRIVIVEQTSMMPTLAPKERVYLDKLAYVFHEPEHGDIIILDSPIAKDTRYVKRIIGLPGDTLELKDGTLYRNGKIVSEPYIMETTSGEFTVTVPEGKYFVMGDNRGVSLDSRNDAIGCIDRELILGKVQFVIMPLSSIRSVY